MRLALLDGQRHTAAPHQRARCPHCDGEVIAKCGPIVSWHWAHRVLDCDSWSEPMTQWHLDWQAHYPADMCEVTIGKHRADVMTADRRVIEFQHSAISVETIKEREHFYGRMVWVFDARDAYLDNRLVLYPGRPRPGKPNNPRYRSYRWKHPRKSIALANCPVYLDLGHGSLLHVRRQRRISQRHAARADMHPVRRRTTRRHPHRLVSRMPPVVLRNENFARRTASQPPAGSSQLTQRTSLQIARMVFAPVRFRGGHDHKPHNRR